MADKLLKYDVAMKSTKTVRQMDIPRANTGDENTVTFDFNITDLDSAELTGATPNVNLYMRDGSFFQCRPEEGVELNGQRVTYTMRENEGKHNGKAKAELVLIWPGTNPIQKLTSQQYAFEIANGLDTVVAVEVAIQDWTTLTRDARAYIDEFAANEILREAEFDNNEFDRNAAFNLAQTNRQNQFSDLAEDLTATLAAADANIEEFDVALETGIVAANLAEKLEDFEEINNSRLLSTERQLADKVGAGVKAEPEDLSAETLGLVTGTGGPINLLSVPQDGSVSSDKLDVALKENLTLTTVNLAPNGDFANGTTSWTNTDGSATVTAADNTLTLTGLGTNANVYVYSSLPATTVGHEYYYRAEIQAEGTPKHFYLYRGSYVEYVYNPNHDSFHVLSGIGQYTTSNFFGIHTNYANAATASGKKINIRKVIAVDLTTMFAGFTRPSLEQIDYIFKKHSELAFVGTKNILSSKKNLLNQARQENDINKIIGTGIISGLSCMPINLMSVQVGSGSVYFNGTRYDIAETSLTVEPSGVTYERTDLIFMDNTGIPRIKKGNELQWLEVPALPSDGMALYEIRVPANSTAISQANIIDRRLFFTASKLSDKVSTIIVAASNSTPQDKAIADYVCDGTNDEVEIQKALDRFVRTSGKVILTNGDYYIDSLFDSGDLTVGKFAVVNKSPDTQREIIIAGVTAPSRNYATANTNKNAPNLILRTALYDSLSADELVTVLGVLPRKSGSGILYPYVSLVVKNLIITVPDNKKNTRMIDAYYTNMFKCDSFMGMYKIFTGHNIKAEGIRGVRGHNAGTGYEISNCFVWGAGIAYNISGEHLIMKNCGVRYSLYPFAFGLTPEQIKNAHPNTLINCCDERCENGPIFGANPNKQPITFIDYNMEVGLREGSAVEQVPGAFVGNVEYAAVGYPGEHDYINVDYPFWEPGSGIGFRTRNMSNPYSGITASRPIHANLNQQYFDTTLNKMVYYTGSNWIDAMGTVS